LHYNGSRSSLYQMKKRQKDPRTLVALRVHVSDIKLAKSEARERDWDKHPALHRKGIATGRGPGYQTILGEWIHGAARRARKNLGDRKRRKRTAMATQAI
jgi:hypothetical protein